MKMSFFKSGRKHFPRKESKMRNTNLACFGLGAVLIKTEKGVFKLLLKKAL